MFSVPNNQMVTLLFINLLVPCLIPTSRACRSKGPTTDPPEFYDADDDYSEEDYNVGQARPSDESEKPNRISVGKIVNSLDRNFDQAWHGWKPSDDIKGDWQIWYNKFRLQNDADKISLDRLSPEKQAQLLAERGPGSGWPSLWADAGIGSGGINPPPWAYGPKHVGKPGYCYQAPDYGRCDKDVGGPFTRYAYNPYMDECQTFSYSGCRGNKNNFIKLSACRHQCETVPSGACNVRSDIYLDDIVALNALLES